MAVVTLLISSNGYDRSATDQVRRKRFDFQPATLSDEGSNDA
jgi:hypothetical protein